MLALILAACPTDSPGSTGPSLTGISIITQPTKLTYTVGEAFTAAGLVISASYSDGSSKTVTVTLSWNGVPLENGNTAITAETGPKTITVTYAGITVTFAITVNSDSPPPPADTTPPANVTGQSKIDGQGQVVLSWTDPPDADLASIEITWTPGGTTPIVIPKGIGKYTAVVANGAYTFTIQAVDASGNRNSGVTLTANPSASAPADTTPPAAVSSLNAVSGNGQITLTWTDPKDGDFASVEITWTPGGTTPQTVTKGTGTYTATGLTGNTEYTFTAKAKDTAGNLSNGQTIAGTPLAPTEPAAKVTAGFTGLPQDETITLSGIQDLSKAANTQLIVSVSDSFSAYRWFLDGVLLPGENTSSLTLNAAGLTIKRYELTVFVTSGSVEYAKSVKFTVKN
jgi:hypothetical protein